MATNRSIPLKSAAQMRPRDRRQYDAAPIKAKTTALAENPASGGDEIKQILPPRPAPPICTLYRSTQGQRMPRARQRPASATIMPVPTLLPTSTGERPGSTKYREKGLDRHRFDVLHLSIIPSTQLPRVWR